MPRENHYIALDLETTGLDPRRDRIIEIGAERFDREGRVIESFERLINPGRPVAPSAAAINGLRDADLADAPRAAEVLPDFVGFLDRGPGAPLIAHNASFDAGFLGMEFVRAGMAIPGRRIVDTLPLARSTLTELRSHRLDLLVAHLGIAPRAHHRALADAAAVRGIWLRLAGPSIPGEDLVSYAIHDGSQPTRPPLGWERLDEAVSRSRPVRIAYTGGSRGAAPRVVTPRSFAHRGGIAYVVATCHLEAIEKSFRLDRITSYEVLD